MNALRHSLGRDGALRRPRRPFPNAPAGAIPERTDALPLSNTIPSRERSDRRQNEGSQARAHLHRSAAFDGKRHCRPLQRAYLAMRPYSSDGVHVRKPTPVTSPIPTGLYHSAQGCSERATLGQHPTTPPTLQEFNQHCQAKERMSACGRTLAIAFRPLKRRQGRRRALFPPIYGTHPDH
jgi:hypothetical protein